MEKNDTFELDVEIPANTTTILFQERNQQITIGED
jgi:hypothetical protein